MPQDASALIRRYMPDFPVRHCGDLHTDTSPFMDIGYGHVMALGGQHYMVLRDEVERRFGMEDPKYWVKRCRVMETGERKIVKLDFHEHFPLQIGPFTIQCHRSPEKESRILDLVRGDMRFMQGFTVRDDVNNPVRILDFIRGKHLDSYVEDIEADHRTYFFEHLPGLMRKYLDACQAIADLHAMREKHGDIRRDHLWVETDNECLRWIDFDYAFDFHENPFGLDIFGLGNILEFLLGKCIHSLHELPDMGFSAQTLASLSPGDFSLMFPHRLMNLRKLYPYIPEELNRVIMHFSASSYVYYDTVPELIEDLAPCLDLLRKG